MLPARFYQRECLEVAADLLGRWLCHGPVVLRITEVEAYRYPGDTASHCRMGRTPRNAPMWGPAGRAYVYLCYGVHQMLNIVTDGPDRGAAVLIRACEPVHGLEEVRARRGGRSGPVLLTGPGKVGAALAVDGTFSGRSLTKQEGLHLRRGEGPAAGILAGPRVGVDYAEPVHRDAPWRVALAGTQWVSRRASLQPVADLRAFLDAQAL